MNVIFIILDSLNRHYLPVYEGDWVETPNLEKLAKKSYVFENHFAGSMPTIPARREMWTGNYEFLWRPWGSLEPWDRPLPRIAKKSGVLPMLITDSYHLFEGGGQNYHIDFEGWEFIRGHEFDPWVTSEVKEPTHKSNREFGRYARNMQRMNKEEEYCSPRTFKTAADWLEENHGHDQFFLTIDEFDPHEPFDVPEHFWRRYDPDYDDLPYMWPVYGEWEGTESELEHIQSRYAGKITMLDRYLGRLFEKMTDFRLWEDTAVVLTADHGLFLGDHGFIGKPMCPNYNTISNIPLIIYVPGKDGGRIKSLTATVDLYPTILELMNIDPSERTDGNSLLPVINEDLEEVRDETLYGYYGNWINYTDGRYTYFRAPQVDEVPFYIYSLRWNFGIQGSNQGELLSGGEIDLSEIEKGRFMQDVNMPVHRAPIKGDSPFKARTYESYNHLYDLKEDPNQEENLEGTKIESEMIEKLEKKMTEINAPSEQFERYGLSNGD